ncbi:MAG: ComEC/Rec2 family competence protein [Candidatus Berkelbacteria bacterium]|nr:ComEC/Rec2 family competence protein [Candidatus Berkelbacteria bacterium]
MVKKSRKIPAFRILTLILAAFIAGVFASTFFDLKYTLVYSISILFLLLAFGIYFLARRNYSVLISIICLSIFFLGIFLFSFRNNNLENLDLPFSQEKTFSGLISNYPDIGSNSQKFFLTTSDFGHEVNLQIQTSEFPNYFYGEKIQVDGALEKPTNSSDFDWVDYLKRYGVVATVKNPKIDLISKNNGNKILAIVYSWRKKFEIACQKNLPEPESSLGVGVLIGSKQGFSQEIINQFNSSGITHVIALSGYNITIIIAALSVFLVETGWISRRANLILSTILILGFVALTGAAASVVRAAIVSLIIAFGGTIGRRADMTNLLLLAAAIMILINPFVLRYDSGFQLSFLAFFGLVFFSGKIEKIFERKIFRWLPNFASRAISETLSAQVVVLPLLLSTFGRLSIVAPLTNVLVLPIVPATMLFVFLSTIIYFLLPGVGHLAFLISYLPLKYILLAAKYCSSLPFSSFAVGKNWQMVFTLVYIIILLLLVFWRKIINIVSFRTRFGIPRDPEKILG